MYRRTSSGVNRCARGPVAWLGLVVALSLAPAARTATPATTHGPVRRALLVAVEDYPNEAGWPRLRGPRADVAAMRSVLVEQGGFAAENVEVLVDEQATRAGIASAFESLARSSRRDDVLLFYFAGHGSQVDDDDGDELDGYDETLIPYDAKAPDGTPNDVLDDDLSRWIALANENTRHVVLIFDCCSSGTNVRGSQEVAVRGVPPQVRGLAGVRGGGRTRRGDGGSGYAEDELDYVSLSACRATQSAFEHEESGAFNGLFTYYLVRELRGCPGDASYEEVLARVRRAVAAVRPGQTPVIEGSLALASLFAGGTATAAASFVVEPSGGGFVVRAGQAHGLRPGTRLAVFANASAIADASAPLATVVLDEVGALESSFHWPASAQAAANDGLRALLVDHGSDFTPLALALSAPEGKGAPLRARIEASTTLAVVDPDEAALSLELDAAGQRWGLRSGDVELPLGARSGSEAEVEHLLLALEHLGRARAVLRGVAKTSSPLLRVRTFLERLDEAGRSLGPVQHDDAGVPTVRPGARLGCRLVNESPVPVFASLLVLSPDGEVGLVVHPQNEDDRIPPGGEVKSPSMTIVLHPESRPFYEEGSECFRWIVSTGFHDLRALQQGSVTRLATLRGQRLTSPRDAESLLAQDEWVTRSIDVKMAVDD